MVWPHGVGKILLFENVYKPNEYGKRVEATNLS